MVQIQILWWLWYLLKSSIIITTHLLPLQVWLLHTGIDIFYTKSMKGDFWRVFVDDAFACIHFAHFMIWSTKLCRALWLSWCRKETRTVFNLCYYIIKKSLFCRNYVNIIIKSTETSDIYLDDSLLTQTLSGLGVWAGNTFYSNCWVGVHKHYHLLLYQ